MHEYGFRIVEFARDAQSLFLGDGIGRGEKYHGVSFEPLRGKDVQSVIVKRLCHDFRIWYIVISVL